MSQVNYREPNDENTTIIAHQLVDGTLKLEDYHAVQDLERINLESNQALKSAHFSTSQEKILAETVQRNTTGWVETGKDALTVAVHIGGLMTTCAPAVQAGAINPEMLTQAFGHIAAANASVQRIYHRACDMAVNNSKDLLLTIENNENPGKNSAINAAAEQHRNDLTKFQRGEVDRNVPYESHKELLKSINASELIQNPDVRENVEQSSRWWDFVMAFGSVTAAAVAIVGFLLLKR